MAPPTYQPYSPHGAIGQPPVPSRSPIPAHDYAHQPPPSPEYIPRRYPIATSGYGTHGATRPRTPGHNTVSILNGLNVNDHGHGNNTGDENGFGYASPDVASLIAQAQDTNRRNGGHLTHSEYPSARYSNLLDIAHLHLGNNGMNGDTIYETGRNRYLEGLQRSEAGGISRHKQHNSTSEIWPRRAIPQPINPETEDQMNGEHTVNGNGNANGIGGQDNSIPHSAPLTFRPFSSPAQRPPMIPEVKVSAGNNDITKEIQSHFEAIQNLVNPLVGDTDEIEKLKKEVETWKADWAVLEKERKRLEGLLQAKDDKQMSESTFTAVLIDGDNLIFHSDLLQLGYQGGQGAAQMLLSGLSASSGDSAENQGRTKNDVIVQVFVNKSGLGTSLIKAGSVSSWAIFESFWQGFSSSHNLLIVVDVGPGQNAAAVKLQGFLTLYAKDAQCENIMLGVSSDDSYIGTLTSLPDETARSKIHFLQASSESTTHHQQDVLKAIVIPDLFGLHHPPSTPAQTSATTSPRVPIQNQNQNQHPQTFSAILQQPATPKTKPPPLESAETSSTGSIEVIDWAAAGKSAKKDKKKKKSKLSSNGAGQPTANGRRASGDGLRFSGDGLRKDADEDGWETAKKAHNGNKKKNRLPEIVKSSTVRDMKPRPCHAYYLSTAGCKSGEQCDYSHDYELDDTQMDELSRLAKEMICPWIKNNKCRFSDEDCVYGHQCPRMGECNFGDTCRFRVLPNGHGELEESE